MSVHVDRGAHFYIFFYMGGVSAEVLFHERNESSVQRTEKVVVYHFCQLRIQAV